VQEEAKLAFGKAADKLDLGLLNMFNLAYFIGKEEIALLKVSR
jgi:hypothetical protein